MKFPKIPSNGMIFWIVVIALLVAMFAIWLSNNNDTVGDLVGGSWFNG